MQIGDATLIALAVGPRLQAEETDKRRPGWPEVRGMADANSRSTERLWSLKIAIRNGRLECDIGRLPSKCIVREVPGP
jgi:hypothetical protein